MRKRSKEGRNNDQRKRYCYNDHPDIDSLIKREYGRALERYISSDEEEEFDEMINEMYDEMYAAQDNQESSDEKETSGDDTEDEDDHCSNKKDDDQASDKEENDLSALGLEELRDKIEDANAIEKNEKQFKEWLEDRQEQDILDLKCHHRNACENLEMKQQAEVKQIIDELRMKHEKESSKLRESQNCQMDELMAKHEDEVDQNRKKYLKITKIKHKIQEELQSRLSSVLPNPTSFIPECYVCLERMKPPLEIMNCNNGHLVCSVCFPKLQVKNCGQCNSAINGRATAMEQMIRQLLNVH